MGPLIRSAILAAKREQAPIGGCQPIAPSKEVTLDADPAAGSLGNEEKMRVVRQAGNMPKTRS